MSMENLLEGRKNMEISEILRSLKVKKNLAIQIGILLVVVVTGMMLISNRTNTGDTKVMLKTEEEVVHNSDSIRVPGYEKLEFKAGKTTQKVTLYNPSQNDCNFKMSLILEDGTVIWQSDTLEPGYAFSRITLDQKLEKGTYENVLLKYECNSVEDNRELNGSQISLMLIVK